MTESREKHRKEGQAPGLPPDGGEMLARHLGGDPVAFPELVGAFRNRIYGYLVRCRVEPEARDDLFQEIFLVVHDKASSFDPGQRFAPWIFTIAANKVRDHFRKSRRNRLTGIEDEEVDPESGHDAHGDVEALETAQYLEDAIGRLPLKQKEALILCCIERFDQARAAETLDVPVATLKTLLRRARLSLAKRLLIASAKVAREVKR